jgi:hypothetical protein
MWDRIKYTASTQLGWPVKLILSVSTGPGWGRIFASAHAGCIHSCKLHPLSRQPTFSYYTDPHSQDEGDAGNKTHPNTQLPTL